jgi:hypothetical protein
MIQPANWRGAKGRIQSARDMYVCGSSAQPRPPSVQTWGACRTNACLTSDSCHGEKHTKAAKAAEVTHVQ